MSVKTIGYDVSPTAEEKLKAQIKTAWPSMEKLLGKPKKKGKLTFTTDLSVMASKAEFIHEAAPEREALKIKLFKDIDAIAKPEVIIASSSSGFLPTRLQSECAHHPERVIIGHPFNPVYLRLHLRPSAGSAVARGLAHFGQGHCNDRRH
jgi:carnitine 3-dehydrogenase